jgi:hypothetical protein
MQRMIDDFGSGGVEQHVCHALLSDDFQSQLQSAGFEEFVEISDARGEGNRPLRKRSGMNE